MASTYTTNLGIEKIATGEQSGTWGSTTNTNLDLIDQAVNGIVQITVAATGSTGSPNALTITNGSASDGRNKFIDFYSPTDLGGTVYYQLDPNDAEKIAFVRNSLGGGQTLVLFQGTYNASNDVEVPNGVDMLVKFDGTGASATVTNVFEKLQVNALSVNDGNITNVGDIALDSISADGTQIDIDITDNTASAFTISEGANNYIEITTTDGSELITVSKNSTFAGTTIADLGVVTTVDINGGTIDGVTIGGASAGAGTFTTLNTTGAVVFNEAGADVDFRVEGDTDANLLFVDASTDNVGIGTSSPKSDDGGNKLEISNNANTVVTLTATNDTTPLLNFRSNAVDRLSIQSSSNFGANFLVRSNQDMRFGTNNTERLRIDSSGNLGLGVTPSAWTTLNPIQFAGGASLAGLGNVGYLGANCYYDGSWRYIASATSGRYEVAADHKWFNAASGTAGNAITFTQAMTLNASGFLGIGQTSPICYVDIYGNGAYTYARFWRSDEAGYGGRVGTGNTLHGSASARSLGLDGFNQISFGIAGSQVAQIDSSGNLGIGTTSPDASMGPGLHIKSASGNSLILEKETGAAIQFRSDASTIRATIGGINGADGLTIATGAAQTERMRIDSTGNLLVGSTTSSLTSGDGFVFTPDANVAGAKTGYTTDTQTCWNMYSSGAAAYRFYVGWGGTVFATNTTISAISDQRLKENIQDLDAGLDKIMALKPRQFDWKEGKGKNVKGDRGFIAQEFEQVFPDLIDEWKDPAPEGEDPYKSVRADLIPVLVKAIQEQQAIIDSLKSRLDAAGL
jgi:hypothetical protein